MLKIDGSSGEGGGQILRYALVYSLLTEKHFTMFNIRKGRKKPGLKTQHLNILKALKIITDSKIEGDKIGGMELNFYPGKLRGGNIFLDFQTAGSIPLFLQTIFPVSLFCENKVVLHLKGGTDVPGGPSIDYMKNIYFPIFYPFFEKFELKIIKRGYYPKGGAEVIMEIKSKENIKELLKRSSMFYFNQNAKIVSVKGICASSALLKNKKVGERLKEGAISILKHNLKTPLDIKVEYFPSSSPGCSITLWGEFNGRKIIASDNLGKIGVPAEKIGECAGEKFLKYLNSNSSLDPHIADHLALWMTLFGGEGSTDKKLFTSKHFETIIDIAGLFIGFKFNEKNGNYSFYPEKQNI